MFTYILFISHVETVDTKENRYIKACNAFKAMQIDNVNIKNQSV